MGNEIEKINKSRINNLIFIGFLIVYSSFLVILSNQVNIYIDDAFSLNTSSNSLGKVLSLSYSFEGQPPVYFLILAIWRTINPGILFARFLSIIFIALSGYFIFRIVRIFSEKGTAQWIVVIFLLNPYTVWAAIEIRTYALLIFLSSISVYYFIKYHLDNKNRYQYYFLLICLIGLYTQYFISFLMIALTISLLMIKGWKPFIKQCFFIIPVVLLFIPNLFFMNNNLKAAEVTFSNYSLINRISVVLHAPQNILLASQIVPFNIWMRSAIKLIFVILVLLAYFILYRKYHKEDISKIKNINGIFYSSFVLIFLFCFFNAFIGIWWGDKYMSVAYPVFIMIFILFAAYPVVYKRLIYVTFSIYFIFLLSVNYLPPVKDYDYKSIAKYIGHIENKNEPILFYSDLISLSFVFYYHGENIIAPLPEATTFDMNYIKNISDTTNLKDTIEKKYGISRSYLLVSDDYRKYSMNLNMNRDMIDKYLNSHYNITLDTLYYGRSKQLYLRVRRLEQRAGNAKL